MLMYIAKAVVIVVGLCFSLFYAKNAVDIFVDTRPIKDDNDPQYTGDNFIRSKMQLPSWRWHQRWLNFMGCAVGWVAVFYFVFCRLIPMCRFSFKVEDTILVLMALLGIAGFLPNALSRVTSLKG